MPRKVHLTREKILAAMKVTQSGHSCSRHLGVDWHTLRDYAKLYKTDDGTQTLYEAMKNPSAKGIPKFKKEGGKQPAVLDIVEGRVPSSITTPQKLKYRLIEEGYLEEKCSRCGYQERRVLDYRMPLLLHHKNNNKKDFSLNNIELLCYNCFFLFCADNVLTDKDIEQIESHEHIYKTTEAINWELDDYHLKRLKELGLMEEDNPNEFVSRI